MLLKRAASVVVLLPVVLLAQSNVPVPGHRAALGISQPRPDEQTVTSFLSRGGKAEKTLAIVANTADPYDAPKKIIVGKVVNRIDGIGHPQIITNPCVEMALQTI